MLKILFWLNIVYYWETMFKGGDRIKARYELLSKINADTRFPDAVIKTEWYRFNDMQVMGPSISFIYIVEEIGDKRQQLQQEIATELMTGIRR